MATHLYRPTEASDRLGLQTSRLRRYVAYFPELFSDYAKRSKNRRYTDSDMSVFRRVGHLGDHVILLSSEVNRSRINSQLNFDKPSGGELRDALHSVQDGMAELRAEVRAYAAVSKAEWSVFADRLAKLEASIDLTNIQGTGRRYRQSKRGAKWHWCPGCSSYPAGPGVSIQNSSPADEQLCRQCLARERAGVCEG